jgi:hypothetical protein
MVFPQKSSLQPNVEPSRGHAKSALLAAIQQEIHRHDFSHFVDEPPSVAEGGKGVVVAGCPACRARIDTMSQFLDHLANDAMPALLDRLSKEQA